MLKTLEHNQGKKEYNPVFLMVDSGARGNRQQVRQLAGVRGLMAKPSGDIIEKPILSNFREGLTVLEYFISTHGARKGLADTALKTADSGYMTRKLVDVAQDVIITRSTTATPPTASGSRPSTKVKTRVVKLSERLVGRYSCDDIVDPSNPKTPSSSAGERVDEIKAAPSTAGIERLKIRSVLTCESKQGICKLLLRPQPGTGRLVAGRSGRHHRRPVHRRARHPAHDAYVPHRWNGASRCVQAAADQAEARRRYQYNDCARSTRRRQSHRSEQERFRRSSSTRTAASWKTTRWSSAPSSPSRTEAGSRRARADRPVGSLQRPDYLRKGGPH
jgi:hypothetical protein